MSYLSEALKKMLLESQKKNKELIRQMDKAMAEMDELIRKIKSGEIKIEK